MRLLTTLTLLTGLLTGMPSQAENIALVGGRLIDGTAERPLHNSVILVKDGIIEQVGTVDSLPVPAGYRVVSTEGHDVLPGLWESHAHIMLTGHANYTHWQKAYRDRQVDEIMPASLVQLLLAGITSVRDLGFDAMDTLRAATYWPAVMMGVQDRYGSVTPGKVADIIAVRGNVLKYINLVRDVDIFMKDGVIFKHNGVVDEALLSDFGKR